MASESVVPASEELCARVRALAPLIASAGAWSEENRRPHDDVVAALADAEIFSLRRPARYGGHEVDARTLVDVIAELAAVDGSTAWNVAVWSTCAWIASTFPDPVQDEVFAASDARVCATLSPTGRGTPVEGGLVVDGRWAFISGAAHSHWQVVIVLAPGPGGEPWPVMALVPMTDLEIVDDWHAAGLCATGSVTTVANDVFVPADRILPMPAVLRQQYASKLNASSPVFGAPLIPTGCAAFAAVAVGLARAAEQEFLRRLPGRRIAYTDQAVQSVAAVTHLHVAEADLLADEAAFHAYRIADTLDAKGAGGEPWKLEDRVRARSSLGRAFKLAKDSVDLLASASGGSSLYRSVPVQRIRRDTEALNLHGLMYPATNLELHGRVLCGLEPNTAYL